MYKQLYEIYNDCFNFCLDHEDKFNAFLKKSGSQQRIKKSRLELCELLLIQIWFPFSKYKDFKSYYKYYVSREFKDYFFLVSYPQVVKLMNKTPFLLKMFLNHKLKKGGKYFLIDSTSLSVCHPSRAGNNKVFSDKANFGYSTMEQKFYGFKLHLTINNHGEIANYMIAKANHHDVKFANKLSNGLKGYLCGDKGYISSAVGRKLAKKGVKLLTQTRRTMKYRNIFHGKEKYLITHRSIIESVFNKMKNVLGMVIHRSRNFAGFLVHSLSALIAYTFDKKKPSIAIS